MLALGRCGLSGNNQRKISRKPFFIFILSLKELMVLFYGIIDMFVIFDFKSDFDSHILVFINMYFNCCGKYFNFLFY